MYILTSLSAKKRPREKCGRSCWETPKEETKSRFAHYFFFSTSPFFLVYMYIITLIDFVSSNLGKIIQIVIHNEPEGG